MSKPLSDADQVSGQNLASQSPVDAEEDVEYSELYPANPRIDEAILAQARALDAQTERLAMTYGGKVVAFYNGEVLCSADTDEGVIAQIREDQKDLPFVIRLIAPEPEPEFMGGPIGE